MDAKTFTKEELIELHDEVVEFSLNKGLKTESDDYRANVTIIQLKKIPYYRYDQLYGRIEVDRWTLPYAWVERYKAPDFDSMDDAVSVAEITITWDNPLYKDYSVKTVSDVAGLLNSFGLLSL